MPEMNDNTREQLIRAARDPIDDFLLRRLDEARAERDEALFKWTAIESFLKTPIGKLAEWEKERDSLQAKLDAALRVVDAVRQAGDYNYYKVRDALAAFDAAMKETQG